MVKTALVLAGGLGTRLRETVADLPKCLAPVAGKPFLEYLIQYYCQQGIEHFIFSLGYKKEDILAYLKKYPGLSYFTVVEEEPLGTGGAIKKALETIENSEEDILILNGDTFFGINLKYFSAFHCRHHADISLALKYMQNISRYGVVELDSDNRITGFKEKQYYPSGLINGGCYLIKPSSFLRHTWPEKFSFEKEFLENTAKEKSMFGYIENSYFIDIGIPDDYYRAQIELPGHIEN